MRELQISAHSMSVLRQYSETNYLDRLANLVGALTHGDESPDQIKAECQELAERARAAGFSTEFEIAAYVACAFAEGHDFEEAVPYRPVVKSTSLSARSKAEMLMLMLEHSGEGDRVEEEG